jgi:hypothetical protein
MIFFSCLNNKTNVSAFLVQQIFFIKKYFSGNALNPLSKRITDFFAKDTLGK